MTKKKTTKENIPIADPNAESKAALIDAFRTMPIVIVACERAKVARPTFYRWMEASKPFEEAVDLAIEEGKKYFNDLNEARMAALMQDKQWNVIRYHLEHHHPQYMKKIAGDEGDKGPSVIIVREHDNTN